jgi:hypothetical protein
MPDEVRFISLYGIQYCIEWEKLMPGHSFFLKTSASRKDVMAAITTAVRYLNFTLVAQERREFGRFGVRVWRI